MNLFTGASGITLTNRVTSGFPISIGTALAIETLFNPVEAPYDPKRVVPPKINLEKYNVFLINIRTLYRNLVSSLTKEDFNIATVEDLATTLEEEINTIQGLMEDHQSHCKLVLYQAEHKPLKQNVQHKRYLNVALREAKTDNQRFFHAQEEAVLKLMNRHTDSIVKFDDVPYSDKYEKGLILTHYVYDLIKYATFSQLDLLESNTGFVKPKFEWNTKFHNFGKEALSHLPFHLKTLLIFGDRSLLYPLSPSIRKAVLEVSIKKNWTPMTTLDKIKLDLELGLADPAMFAIIRTLG